MVMHNTRKIVALAAVNTTPNRATVVIITLMIIYVTPHGSCCHHFKVLFHAWASYIYIYGEILGHDLPFYVMCAAQELFVE